MDWKGEIAVSPITRVQIFKVSRLFSGIKE
jgi:hypothetical protein